MTKQSHRAPLQEMFDTFPRGLAVLEMNETREVSTWRMVLINRLAASLVAPSIETFLSSARLRLGSLVDLPNVYLEFLSTRRSRMLGIVETRSSAPYNERLYMVSVLPAGMRCVAILFEGADSTVAGHSARALAERQLAQTCEFVGAILWRADPETLQFTYVSPHAQAILGYWLERWTGETNFWKKHLFPDDRQRLMGVCEKIARDGRKRDFEFRIVSAHGQTLGFHAAAQI